MLLHKQLSHDGLLFSHDGRVRELSVQERHNPKPDPARHVLGLNLGFQHLEPSVKAKNKARPRSGSESQTQNVPCRRLDM